MNLAVDLLEQADHLSRRELKRPRQASLRRSTSTAYYALFHLLSADGAAIMMPNVSDVGRSQFQRSFNHQSLKQVCDKFAKPPLSDPLKMLIGSPVTNDMMLVAQAFVQLQEARHSADYDTSSNWDRPKARRFVQMARDAFDAWHRIRKLPETNVFLLSFVLLKTLESPR